MVLMTRDQDESSGPRSGARPPVARARPRRGGHDGLHRRRAGEQDDEAEPAALDVRVVTCAGRLGDDARAEIEAGIGDALSAYVVKAFLGDYPRDDFVRAFDGFTSGAAEHAAEDIDLLTAEPGSRTPRGSPPPASRRASPAWSSAET